MSFASLFNHRHCRFVRKYSNILLNDKIKQTLFLLFCSDFENSIISRTALRSSLATILSSEFALRSFFVPILSSEFALRPFFVPILSSEWCSYNTAIKPRAESNLFELCRGVAVKGRHRRAKARLKRQRRAVLSVLPFVGFLVSRWKCAAITIKLLIFI